MLFTLGEKFRIDCSKALLLLVWCFQCSERFLLVPTLKGTTLQFLLKGTLKNSGGKYNRATEFPGSLHPCPWAPAVLLESSQRC